MRGPAIFIILSALALSGLLLLLKVSQPEGPAADGDRVLTLYVAAGVRKPVDELLAQYQAQYGVRTQVRYGGSGTLLAQIAVASSGDLFIAGDVSFIHRAQSQQWVQEDLPLAHMTPVIAVAAGNPHGIRGLTDLANPSLAVGLAQPQAAAVGRKAQRALEAANSWASVEANVRVFKHTVGDLANDLTLGALDAAVIWDATLAQHPGLQAIHTPELDEQTSHVSIGVLTACEQPTAALRLARFLSAPDRGGPTFRKHGFALGAGDPWAEVPQIDLFCGAMLRSAVDDTLDLFAQREGIVLRRTYNGCGVLVAQMRAGAEPDAYFACDESFLTKVQTQFTPGQVVSSNPIVLLTAPGNPLGLTGLADLCQPELRVGLCDPDKSALGALSDQLLTQHGIMNRLAQSGNVRLRVPTGDLLVNQLRTGALDAALVYASNAAVARQSDEQGKLGLTVVDLGRDGLTARQPWAIARVSPHTLLLARLYETLTRPPLESHFQSLGFGWEASQ